MFKEHDNVLYKNYLCQIRFVYPEYKNKRNYYVIIIPGYRGFTKINKLVCETDIELDCQVMIDV